MPERPCIVCGRPTNNPKCCSVSCSAKHSNKNRMYVHRRRRCAECGVVVSNQYTVLCIECTNKHRREKDGSTMVCEICGKEYVYATGGKSGHSTINRCKSCRVNHRRFAVKRKMLEYKGNKCSVCGFDKYLSALVFHHLRDKKFGIGGDHSRSWESIQSELDKCILLCQNCHAEMHTINHKTNFDSRAKENILVELVNGESRCEQCNKVYEYKRGKGSTPRLCNSCVSHNRKNSLKVRAVEYKGGKCEACGYDKCVESLTFHHTDPSKKDFALSSMQQKDWATNLKELDKCQLLCFNCHQELHAKESKYYKFYYGEIGVPGSSTNLYRKHEPKEHVKVFATCPVCGTTFEGNGKHCSAECAHAKNRKVANRPSREELTKLLETHSFLALGRVFGVTDNCIRKWLGARS